MIALSDYTISTPEDGRLHYRAVKGNQTLQGRYYQNMRTRAKNPNYKALYPTYKDVSITPFMDDFQLFAEWCLHQKGFGYKGFVLDKDITCKGNQVYDENKCVFVPPVINAFILNNYSKVRNEELPIGVTLDKSCGKYMACCARLNGKNTTVGRFKTTTEAGIAYINFKNNLALVLADTWKPYIDERVYDFLLSYNVQEHCDNVRCTHPLYNKENI